jgi:acyl-CoA hydrolase
VLELPDGEIQYLALPPMRLGKGFLNLYLRSHEADQDLRKYRGRSLSVQVEVWRKEVENAEGEPSAYLHLNLYPSDKEKTHRVVTQPHRPHHTESALFFTAPPPLEPATILFRPLPRPDEKPQEQEAEPARIVSIADVIRLGEQFGGKVVMQKRKKKAKRH